MRTARTLYTTPITTTKTSSPSPAATTQRSPWHSPVPYLFGGLAAMLGLIAFALLILACSYWKLSGDSEGGERDLENGDEKAAGDSGTKAQAAYEEKIVVIMAGDEKPTFLAVPVSAKACFGDCNAEGVNKETDKTENKEKEEMDNHQQSATTQEDNRERENQENPQINH